MRSCLLFILSLFLPSISLAQGGGLSGGSSSSLGGTELAIYIRTTDGQSIRGGVRVELLNLAGVPVDEATIRGEGIANFLNVTSGMYRVRVSGDGYQTATSDNIEVSRNQRYRSENMFVNVVNKDAESHGTPGMVDARSLQIPVKAKKELDKGMEAFGRGDSKSALGHLNRAIEIYPEYAQAYNDLGVIRINLDDTAGAKEAFEKSVKLNDHFAPAFANLARMALERHDLPKASGMVDKAASSDPLFVDGLALQARVRFLEGRYDEALALVGRVHSLPHNKFAEVDLIAAEIYGMNHRNPDAIVECETYLKEDPQSPAAVRVRKTITTIQARKD